MNMSAGPTATPTAVRRKSFALLLVMAFLNTMGITIIVPIVPFLTVQYLAHATDLAAIVGWLTAAYALCQLIAAPGLGVLSDHFGRRPIRFICLPGSTVGYLLSAVWERLAADALAHPFRALAATWSVSGYTGGQRIASERIPLPHPKSFARPLIGAFCRCGETFWESAPRERCPAMSLLELFCRVDDFWKSFAPAWHQRLLVAGPIKRQRAGKLSASEIMTILIQFHQSHYRDWKRVLHAAGLGPLALGVSWFD